MPCAVFADTRTAKSGIRSGWLSERSERLPPRRASGRPPGSGTLSKGQLTMLRLKRRNGWRVAQTALARLLTPFVARRQGEEETVDQTRSTELRPDRPGRGAPGCIHGPETGRGTSGLLDRRAIMQGKGDRQPVGIIGLVAEPDAARDGRDLHAPAPGQPRQARTGAAPAKILNTPTPCILVLYLYFCSLYDLAGEWLCPDPATPKTDKHTL